jgi:hypothetical protein
MKKLTDTKVNDRSKINSVALGEPRNVRRNAAVASIMIPPARPAHIPPSATFQKGILSSVIN